ncbi:MAG TPA: hypothetical protein VK835_14540 [Bacteroidia bacterium]|jgi:hypothetical protein|nr:hypothetical protein [Bacteroidia bacterium]
MKKGLLVFLFFAFIAFKGFAQIDESDTSIARPYTLDLEGSKFKLNSYSKSPMYFYTVDGLGNPFDFPFPNHFSIIDKSKNVGNIKEFVDLMIKMCKTGLKVLNSLKEKETEINGYKAYEISFTGRIDSTFFKTYMVVLSNGKTTLLFTGRTVSDYDEMIKEFKAIVKTIKIK